MAVLAVLAPFALATRVNAQTTTEATQSAPATGTSVGDEQAIQLDTYTVSSATRTVRAIDHIPGAVMAITPTEISQVTMATIDPDELLSQMIPGYSASYDDLTTSGELLRGRRPEFLLDGVLMSSPLRDVGRMAAGMVDESVIDHVEVVEGASAIEGLGGSGGLINYITKTPTQEGLVNTLDTSVASQFENSQVAWKVTDTTLFKKNAVDFLLSLGIEDQPMYYDAKGNLEPINTNGSYLDSEARSIVAKLGYTFGPNNDQRVSLYVSDYDLQGNNNYHDINGVPALGQVYTAARGNGVAPPAGNLMRVFKADYTNSNVVGGNLKVIVYKASDNIVNGPGVIDPSKQDPNYAPIGTLVDVSQIVSNKRGVEAYWSKQDLFITGLGLTAGYDYINDQTYQNLLLTNRTWLPNLDYTGNSGFAQANFDHGPITLSAGLRYQEGSVSVPTFRTLYETAPATDGVVFTGGSKSYNTTAENAGIVYRFSPQWSSFFGFSQGFALPDIGTVIRNTTKPNQSMASTVALGAITTNDYDFGINWHNEVVSMGVDLYYNHSPASTTVTTDPVTLIQTISRTPIQIEGVEFNGEWKITKQIKLTGTYSKMVAYTAPAAGLPVDVSLSPTSTNGQQPDKAVVTLDYSPTHDWNFNVSLQNYFREELNVGRTTAQTSLGAFYRNSGYCLLDASISYRTKSWGTWSLGGSNLTDTYHIIYQNPTSATTYYSVFGRKVVLSNRISF